MMRGDARAGEPAVALHSLCSDLYEVETVPLDAAEVNEIAVLAGAARMSKDEWRYVRKLLPG